jgi:hypothetical protein
MSSTLLRFHLPLRPPALGLRALGLAWLLAGCGGDGEGVGGLDSRSGTVAGTVTLDGAGVPGATLTLETTPPRPASTGVGGAYRFDRVPSGTWAVTLTVPEGSTFPETSRTITAAPGQEARVDFHGVLPRTAALEGRVTVGAAPLPAVEVELTGPESRVSLTDSAGAFRFDALVRGEYRLQVAVDPTRWAFSDAARTVSVATGAALTLDFEGVRVPRPPARPTLEASALTPRRVMLSWNAVDEVEEYRLDRREGAGAWEPVASAATDTALEDAGVDPGGRYEYRLEACNDDGCSEPSTATVTTPLTPPSAPEGLTASAAGTDRIRLRWSDTSSDETEFRIRRRPSGGAWEPAGSADADATTFLDAGLTPSTVFHYEVQACGQGGCSEFSAEATARTQDEPPSAPTDVAATALSPTDIRVTWEDGIGVVEEVRVERQVEGGSWTQVGVRPGGAGLLEDSQALPATLHAYRLRACNDGGCSATTPPVQVTTPQAPPAAPTALTATGVGGDRVDLAWQAPASAVEDFRLQRRVGGGSWGDLATVGPGVTTYEDTDVTEGQVHGYRVQACNEAGCSPFTPEASATPVVSALNLSVEAVHLNQVVQTLGGGVPLVAGRGGVLRVFVKANMPNTARPAVRVRLYHGTGLVATHTLAAPGTSVPEDPELTVFGSSWNVTIPGSQVVPGLAVLVDVDPDGTIPESDRSDNVFPAPGSPLALDVRTVPPFRVRFVPVHQSATGLTGSVNAGSLLADALQLFPLRDADADVRLPYTTALDTLRSDDSNNAWTALLSELNALRVAEGSDRHYYGVVRTLYTSGIAGYGYVGGRTAVGWDRSGAAWVAAHEWGHNFGRRHAPCSVTNPDPSYPYAGGVIGVPGWNGSALVSAGTRDLMGYCSPRWISDYTFTAVMDHRGTEGAWGAPVAGGAGGRFGAVASGVAWGMGAGVGGGTTGARAPSAGAGGSTGPLGSPVPALVIWGRIAADGSSGVLEPAFQVTAPASLPAGGGSSVVEGLDAAGALLFSLPFEAILTGEEDGRHFAFALPLESFPAERLATVTLRERGRVLDSRGGGPPAGVAGAPAPDREPPVARRRAGAGVEVRWDARREPLLVIRDAASGQILSLARGGRVVLPQVPGDLEVTASDGIRSRVERIRP